MQPTARSDMSPDLVLVDGSSYLFRAYHALPPLSNSRKEPTGAIIGVVNMLRKLQNELASRYIAVIFDAPGLTFRDELSSEYKAQRPPVPTELIVQIEPLHAIIRALGLPLLSISGVEADDVIGTLASQAQQAGLTTLIITGDKDFAQLVTEHITLLDTMTERRLDVAGVQAKFGVIPQRMVDLLALTGDQVDNILGVPGCGPKTALKWLDQYGNLEGVIAHAAAIKSKVGEALRSSTSRLLLNRQLVTIKCDVPLPLGVEQLSPTAPDIAALRHWYQHLEAHRLLSTLPTQSRQDNCPKTPAVATPTETSATTPITTNALSYQLILTEASLYTWLDGLREVTELAFTIAATNENPLYAQLVGMAFATNSGPGAYIPLAHSGPDAGKQLPLATVLAALKPILEDSRYSKIGHDLKYHVSILASYGIVLRGLAFDTMLESYLLDATAANHSLNALLVKYLQQQAEHHTTEIVQMFRQQQFAAMPLEQASHHTITNAALTLKLHTTLWQQLILKPHVMQLLQNLEMPLVSVLAKMERVGVGIDVTMLQLQSQELGERLQMLEQRVQSLCAPKAQQALANKLETWGTHPHPQPPMEMWETHPHPPHPVINLSSPKQIASLLFTEQGLPILEKTATGNPSTGESVLERLSRLGHELPKLILEHRTLAKLKSTYLDPLPRLINATTGRLHTSYNQAVTSTGRLSSSQPNLQNIPIRTEEGRRIRQAFVAAAGYSLLAADYSQIELRIMAHLSNDSGLLKAFTQGLDVHRSTAAEVLQIPLTEVTEDQRRSAKAINFGLIYGMSAFGLAKQLAISNGEAKKYMERYFQRYPGVKDFMEHTRVQAKQQGFVETLWGRRLYLPDITSRHHQRRAAAERVAINAPMQGTAADIIKSAMLYVDEWLQTKKIPARLIMQVHDELVLEVRNDFLEQAQTEVKSLMESAAVLRVPLVVNCGVGVNWEQSH